MKGEKKQEQNLEWLRMTASIYTACVYFFMFKVIKNAFCAWFTIYYFMNVQMYLFMGINISQAWPKYKENVRFLFVVCILFVVFNVL